MNVPPARPHVSRGLGAAAVAVLGVALVVAPSTAEGAPGRASAAGRPVADPSPGQAGGHTVLTCAAATAPSITFDPPVAQASHTVTAKGALTLTGCTSPDGSFPKLSTGKVTLQGSGPVSCTGVQNVTGTGTITWKDAQGQTLGTSTIRPNLDAIPSFNPGDMLLVGEVTEGKMKGKRIAGKATPTSDISQCSSKGLGGVQGSGGVAFIAVDAPK
ncbi:hypothetical protein JOL79_11925 [Microbispora sp. RL4-1S]|uniref:Uncharacterized protein n=1 Tax=Microbispora oryzae TaxID=2806554 RepID=A0A940WID3_9ACTN|nr:hypothetical protein [Microbispora oryzae]MBP2704522.1 hypothetical protein [Microbispora oryzae]